MFDLTGKTALVTGGNSGIGFGIAKGLIKAGAKVAIIGRNQEKNNIALKELNAINSGNKAYVIDLFETKSIKSCYQNISKDFGGIDILFNNAGTQARGRADFITEDDFDRVLTVNLKAPYILAQCFARERIEKKLEGRIIFTASLMSEASRPQTSVYTASKGGIRQLIKALAVDWAPFGILVNGIGPGYIKTEMTAPLSEDTEFNDWVLKRTPLNRWGTPADFEGLSVFLASEESAFITGQIFYVDGGWLATF